MIKIPGAILLVFGLLSLAPVPIAQAAGAQTVAVTLQDTSVDPAIHGMVIKIEPATLKAGRVRFEAVNESKNLVHETLVVRALPDGTEMPYDNKKDAVVEKRVRPLGEISDLKPGARGKLTLNLKPGAYLLFCNQPGHFKAGMSTRLVVEK